MYSIFHTSNNHRGHLTWYRPGYFYVAVFYKVWRLDFKLTSVTPAQAVSNGCKLSSISDQQGTYQATHVYSWILECHDAYNNRITLPEKSLNRVIVPMADEVMFVTKEANNGTVEMSLR